MECSICDVMPEVRASEYLPDQILHMEAMPIFRQLLFRVQGEYQVA